MKNAKVIDIVDGNIVDNQIQFQDLLISISEKFINHDLSDIDNLIETSLRQIGQFVNADRSYVFTYDLVNKTTSNTHEWCNIGIQPEKENLQNVPVDFIKDWMNAHEKGKAFYVPEVALLPKSEDEYSLRNLLEPQGIKSLIAIPQIRDNKLIGFVGFDSVRHIYNYSDNEKDILFVFANMLANVQQRKEQDDIIKEQERKKEILLKNLSDRNEKLNEYAQMVSHDLKSPLINMNNLVEWFIMDNKDLISEERMQPLRNVLFNAEKMDALIKGILDYSVVSEEDSLNNEVDLNELLAELKMMMAISENIFVIVQENLPSLYGNKLKFQQLFQNLIQNAIKFNDKDKGIIEVTCKTKDDHYEFAVSDNGIGINAVYFDKIFKTFTKLESSSSSSGVGLAIVKKVVELNQGTIWLESEEGKGTTFFFTIKK
ncbi:MAG: GAF domain-containing protein [Winogradskyella sp.]|uniref:GAF domain-containing sensor histidine kinase n=1 Tax=Winogradskyella sp. TaxID=1883156 RepID=UPI0025FE4EBD|nr:ATP-binding protein [Winogradskyella sp.]NRB58475.1 GAF domain-containing protein [Winogradskyella sp.]